MNHVRDFIREEDGIGVVEIILILVVHFTSNLDSLRRLFGMCMSCMALKIVGQNNDVYIKQRKMCMR